MMEKGLFQQVVQSHTENMPGFAFIDLEPMVVWKRRKLAGMGTRLSLDSIPRWGDTRRKNPFTMFGEQPYLRFLPHSTRVILLSPSLLDQGGVLLLKESRNTRLRAMAKTTEYLYRASYRRSCGSMWRFQKKIRLLISSEKLCRLSWSCFLAPTSI